MPPAFVLLHSGRFHKTVAVYNSCFFVKSTLEFSILHLKLKLFLHRKQNFWPVWPNSNSSESWKNWRRLHFHFFPLRLTSEPNWQPVQRSLATFQRRADIPNGLSRRERPLSKNNRGEKKIADGTARNIAASVSWQKAGPEARRVARLAWWPPTAAAPILVEELGPRRVGLASGAWVFEAQRSKMLSSVTQTPQRAELRPELWVSVSL